MTDEPQRFRRPLCSYWIAIPAFVVAAVVNELSGFDASPLRGPGHVAVTIAGAVLVLQSIILRRPVWIDPSKRELRWSTVFGLSFGTWSFDEVTSARLSNSWFRWPTRDTILLRIGWIRLSFEVPLGTGYDVIEMLVDPQRPDGASVAATQ